MSADEATSQRHACDKPRAIHSAWLYPRFHCFRQCSGTGTNTNGWPWATGRGTLWPSQFPHCFASRRFPRI